MLKEIHDFNGSATQLLNVFSDEPLVFLLESSLFQKDRGRYSILGFDPFHIHRQKDVGHLDNLRKDFKRYRRKNKVDGIPLASGIVGFIGYDYGLWQEGLENKSIDELGLPDCLFGFYDCIVTLDQLKKKLIITSSGQPEGRPRLKTLRAQERLNYVKNKLALTPLSSTGEFSTHWKTSLESNFTEEQYINAVNKALDYIGNGDIYQVNLSQRFKLESERKIEGRQLYDRLTRLSPSSFGGYFDAGDFQIISSSPERFLCLQGDRVHTRPMKGTAPRGRNRAEDERLRQKMGSSEKEKAELLMITDLERNDLGRVCRYGSVRVQQLRTIETYRTVFQATSTVEGKLEDDKNAFDLIRACFPGGSITGCPKLRSMQIIEELEPTRRGIYTGSMGYIDFGGDMDLNILIRTVLLKDTSAYFQVGGGIVADSRPQSEYEETQIKAKAMKEALSALPSQKHHVPQFV